MLVSKLLRIEEKLVEQIEELAKKMSETEYTSFSALARKLIKNGLKMLPRSSKTTFAIPRYHYSKLNCKNPKSYNDVEIENVMGALDCFYDMEKSNEGSGNHIMIEFRANDKNGEHFGVWVRGIDGLKTGDEIYIGLPDLYKLVVVSQDENEVSG